MAKRGYKRPEERDSPLEKSSAIRLTLPEFPIPSAPNGSGNHEGNGKPPVGLGAAALTWRHRIAALGVERRAREVAFLDSTIAERTKTLRALKESLAAAQRELHDHEPLGRELQDLKAERERLRQEVDELRRQKETLARIPEDLAAAQAELSSRMQDGESRWAELQERIAIAETDHLALEERTDQCRREIHDAKGRLKDIEFEAHERRDQIAAGEKQVRSATEELEKLNTHIDRARAEFEASAAEREIQLEKLDQVRAQVATEETAVAGLFRQVAGAKEVLDDLAKERGELETVIDRLANERRRMDEEANEQEMARRGREANLARLDHEILGLHQSLMTAKSVAESESERFAKLRREQREQIDEADLEIHRLQGRLSVEEERLAALAAQQEEARTDLARLEAAIGSAQGELETLGQRRAELEGGIVAITADHDHHLAQRRIALEELESVRNHLSEAGSRLGTLRDLVEERELDLAGLYQAKLVEQSRHQEQLRANQAELAEADLRIQESCAALARLSQEIEVGRTSVAAVRALADQESARLEASQEELRAHLLRKETELGTLQASLAAGQEAFQAFLEEREVRQQEVLGRLSQALTKRKVAEDDLAAKLQQLETINGGLAQAGEAKLELAEVLEEKARAETALAESTERVRFFADQERSLEIRISALNGRACQLEELEGQIHAREEELRTQEARARSLEERSGQLEQAASLETGTIQVLAKDLIGEIDALDEQIVRFELFEADRDFAVHLDGFRQSLLELLGRHGVFPYQFNDGEKLGPEARDHIEIVGTKSERSKEIIKVIETVRPGYIHGDTILRRAVVVTSHA